MNNLIKLSFLIFVLFFTGVDCREVEIISVDDLLTLELDERPLHLKVKKLSPEEFFLAVRETLPHPRPVGRISLEALAEALQAMPPHPKVESFDMSIEPLYPGEVYSPVKASVAHSLIVGLLHAFPNVQKLNFNYQSLVFSYGDRTQYSFNRFVSDLEGFKNLNELSIAGCVITQFIDKLDLHHLSRLPKLKSIDLSYTYLLERDYLSPDSEFVALFSLPQIEKVVLHGTMHLPALLFTALECPTLTDLELNYHFRRYTVQAEAETGSIATLNLAPFAPNLRRLSLTNYNLSYLNLEDLAQLEHLEELKLSEVILTETQIEQMHWTVLPNLQCLDLTRTAIKNVPFDTFVPALKVLILSGSGVNGSDCQSISRLTQLEKLDLSNTKISKGAIKVVSKIKSLRHLILANTEIKDAALDSLTQLEILSLAQAHLWPPDIEKLKRLVNLKRLDLRGIQSGSIQSHHIEALRHALPNCQILSQPLCAEH